MQLSRATVFISTCCAITSTAARVTKRESLLRHRSLQGGGPPGGGPPGGGGGGGGGTTCSTNLSPRFGNPSQGRCAEFTRGTSYLYPEDFGDILNDVSVYTCPTSDTRIIVSNGIPDHFLQANNPNDLCEQHWMVTLPLNPTLIAGVTEPSALGIIGMSVNGVPVFGGQEGGGTNAVGGYDENGDRVGVPYYGHAARSGDWHYHSGEFGLSTQVASVPSEHLLGYAMDGFPIYGPLGDSSVLDSCNGIGDSSETYRYHVRTLDDVDGTLGYCDGTSEAVNWKYVVGCFKGDLTMSSVQDSTTATLPADCILETSTSSDTPAPTAAPTAAPALGTCFSGSSLVNVRGRGEVAMKHLQVGDFVQTDADGKFERVYSFGHRAHEQVGSFKKLITEASSLELSSAHMVFTKGRGFVPASNLREGDVLVNGEGTLEVVKSIKTIKSTGVYAPFTPSGTILVNNLLASSFVAFQDQSKLFSFIPLQWLAHSFEFPHRIACHYLTSCPNESYTVEGISTWVAAPHRATVWLMSQPNGFLKTTLMSIIVAVLALFSLMEKMAFVNPVLGFTIVVGCAIVGKGVNKAKKRKAA